jgi:hypothetical protein
MECQLDKCVVMKISWQTGDTEKIKCNNHETKERRALNT